MSWPTLSSFTSSGSCASSTRSYSAGFSRTAAGISGLEQPMSVHSRSSQTCLYSCTVHGGPLANSLCCAVAVIKECFVRGSDAKLEECTHVLQVMPMPAISQIVPHVDEMLASTGGFSW